jgi:GNAT superfamily N-acetyltransferase
MMDATDPTIRLLTTGDLSDAFGLSATAGWNQRIADWRMLLQLAPAGAFTAVTGSHLVGTAIGIDYGTFGWIAMMLVEPAWRGRGLGARLLEAAIDAVPPERPIRLDATPLGRPLYRRYGFEDEATLTRHVAETVNPRVDESAAPSCHVRRLTAADLPAIAALDSAVFGADRRTLLDWTLRGAPHYAHVVESEAGMHYCLGRAGRLFDQIGPVVTADDEMATALVSASLGAAEARTVAVDAFDGCDRFTAWLRSRGFAAQRPLFRMRRPGRDAAPTRSDAWSQFSERAILGPEFG